MRKIWIPAVSACVSIALLAAAASASAATEFGDACVGTTPLPPTITAVQTKAAPGSVLPVAAPSSGVITKWKINLTSEAEGSFPEHLLVMRPLGIAAFQVIGESEVGNMAAGTNTFATRLPVAAGDHLAVRGSGPVGAALCGTSNPADGFGVIEGSPSVGSTVSLSGEGSAAQVAVTAGVEPDVDGDGFGDETQDKCPQSAAYQTPCPVIKVGTFPIASKGSVTVLVTTDNSAPVSVTGAVKLGKGKPLGLSAAAQTVAPGQIAKFVLKFPAKLKSKLKELTAKKKLKLSISAGATNVSGQVSSTTTKVTLKGQDH